MCGILGVININISDNGFKAALDTIAHRGPDSYGIWRDDNKAVLGHRRLAIIDLSTSGQQPMQVENRYTITFNGEIYNFKELRVQLHKLGHSFESDSDTEIVLKSYIQWGKDCVQRFNGMWAMGIWDSTKNELFLSRDRLGKKPLFYSFLDGNKLVFSSEMKAIYPFQKKFEYDLKVIESAKENNFTYESTDQCIVKGIKRFPAASSAIYNLGDKDELVIDTYWSALNKSINISKRYEDQVIQFKELFVDACKLRMRADVDISTALSGGVDSSAIASVISEYKDEVLGAHEYKTFTASFTGTDLDETDAVKTLQKKFNLDSAFININPIDDLDNITHQAYMFEEIYYAPTVPFVQLYKKIKSSNYKVSIDGHGADELFGGYPFILDALTIDDLPDVYKLYKHNNQLNDLRPSKVSFSNALKFALPHKFPLLQKIASNAPTIHKIEGLNWLNSELYKASFKTILPTLLRNYDRYSMINGVEIRMPFLDYRLVELAFALPSTSKFRNGFTKSIVRDAFNKKVPDEILYNKSKIGFNAPINAWVKNAKFKDWLLDQTESVAFVNSELIDSKKVKSKINALFNENLDFLEASSLFESINPYLLEEGNKKYGTLSKVI